jgi:glycosyltransferase involved in cell wall biosynthesis
MEALYRAADAVFLPSQGEGLPLTVQEAMACGLPAIIPDDEVYSEQLLRERVCVGARRDPEAMAAALAFGLRREDALSARARHYAVKAWSLDAMIQRYVDILAGLAAASAKVAT